MPLIIGSGLTNDKSHTDAIKQLYVGDDEGQSTLMSLIRYNETSSRVLLSKRTMKNYGATEKYTRKFLQYKYGGMIYGWQTWIINS